MSNLQKKLRAFYAAQENNDGLRIRILEYLALIQDAMQNETDPKSGDYMPVPISTLFVKLENQLQSGTDISHERVFRMLSFLRKPLEEILESPRNKIERFHQLMPQYQARNFDRQSIQWMIRRPGKNLTEKIALSPQIMAVKRNFVLDTSENRLLKEFLRRFYELLQLRQKYFTKKLSSSEMRLGSVIASWLREEGSEIGKWNNVPPNNILLNNKHYRKVWDAWCDLRQFEAFLQYDFENVNIYSLQFFLFGLLYRLSERGIRFAEFPIKIDYATDTNGSGFALKFYPAEINGISICDKGNFPVNIKLLGNKLLLKIKNSCIKCEFDNFNEIDIDGDVVKCENISFDAALITIVKRFDEKKLLPHQNSIKKVKQIKADSITIDFAYSNMLFCKSKNARNTEIFLARQYWDALDTSVSLSNVAAWQFSDESQIFSIANILWNNLANCKNISSLAKELAQDTKNYILAEDITFVIPDAMDDFGDNAKYFKQAFEGAFSDSNITWIPTSIATVFSLREKWNILPKKTKCYCIVEQFVDKLTITPVLLKKPSYSEKLQKECPETLGYIWERQQPYMQPITGRDLSAIENICDISTTPVFADGVWRLPSETVSRNAVKINNAMLKEACQNVVADDIEIVFVSSNLVFDENRPIGHTRNYSELLQNEGCRIISSGGETLREMQKKFTEHPLWTDNLPPISLIFIGGQELKLISDDHDPIMTTGKQEILLTTSQCKLRLHGGELTQEFDVKRQKGKNSFRYKAKVCLQELLQNDTNCVVKLYYTYGAAEPYRLIFEPEKGATELFKPVQAQLIPIAEALLEDKANYYSAPIITLLSQPWDKNDLKQQRRISFATCEFSVNWWREFGKLLITPELYLQKNTRKINFVGHANRPIRCHFVTENEGQISCYRDSFCNPSVFDTLTSKTQLCAAIRKDPKTNYLYGECIYPSEFTPNFIQVTHSDCITFCVDNEHYSRLYKHIMNGKNTLLFPKNRGEKKADIFKAVILSESKCKYFSTIAIKFYDSEKQFGVATITESNCDELVGQTCSFNHRNFCQEATRLNVTPGQIFYALISKSYTSGNFFANMLCCEPIKVYDAFIYSVDKEFEEIKMQNISDFGLTDMDESITVYKESFDNEDIFLERMKTNFNCVIDPKGKRADIVTTNTITNYYYEKLCCKTRKNLLFNLNKLYNFGYRDVDKSTPVELQQYCAKTADELFALLQENSNSNQVFAGTLAEWLCHYGQYMPKGLENWLIEQVTPNFCPDSLAFCIGNAKCEWQQKLWSKMVTTLEQFYDEDSCLKIVEIAIQKFDKPIHMMTYALAERVVSIAHRRITKLFVEIKLKENQEKLGQYLRLLWFLLRLRKHEDDSVRKILHPGKERTQQLAEIILTLNNLNVNIPLPYNKAQKLTDALYNYLNGSNPDTSIELVGDDDDDEQL